MNAKENSGNAICDIIYTGCGSELMSLCSAGF